MKDLTIGNERKLILQFALPMLLGNLFQQSYNIVDSIVVGRFIGKEALAAVGASFPVIFILISLVIGFSMGLTVIISQYYGAKDFRSIKRSIDTLNIILLITSIIITLISISFSTEIFQLMQLPVDVIPQAEEYFTTYMLGSIAFFGFNGVSAVLRGLGDSKTPLYFLIIATVLNIILVLLFVIVFDWGVKGAAISTIIAQGISFLLSVLYLNKYHKLVKVSFINIKFDKKIFLQSLRIGLPSGLQHTFVSIGMMALYAIVNSFGTDVSAAYAAVMRIDTFASLPAMNFAIALSTFVGQNIGANKIGRVKQGLLATFVMTSGVAIFVSIGVILFGKELMYLFTTDSTVIALGHDYLIIVCSFYLVFTTMLVISSVLRGAGDTLIPMFVSLFSLWLVRIPFAYFLSQHFGVQGIWWSIPIGWFCGLLFIFLYYMKGNWKNKSVVSYTNPGH
ncbi:MAG: MATE family efflux transporter [Bacteroidetes bacterium RIFOXYA12_FULL_35_11]|nr:MAG: MATE family efflux transporter [Bacteroidetes bacterium GWF2_35_48]OFY72686.1 MAG: MATE family efflux transporter [Bacteroidetes bacterium RIFOXYA12_FULL_35_11]OFY93431.1 MAG: MATE family efflux transporter [Bacteroidetes bacterium RIFOXYB2_FULL_35_7]HBX50997.1 MATE family efflux transporter [Bacteroidales bacterium]